MTHLSTDRPPLMSPGVELVRCYGSSWNLKRADRRIWVADRTVGSSTTVLAGTAEELLVKLDRLPKITVALCPACTG